MCHTGHGRYLAVPIVCFVLMMTKTIFSQTAMEVYAYNYIAQCKVEKSSREDRIKLQSKQKSDKKIKTANDKTQQSRKSQSLAFSFIKPVDGGRTSSYFGDSVDRVNSHKGHDWAVPTGTEVKAAEKGLVELAYYSESYGYNVLVRHSKKTETRYAHMSELFVSKGEEIVRGQVLGLSGSTGDSTGPHLHFEVIKNGIRVNPLSIFK